MHSTGQLIRGLAEAYYRNPGTDMATYAKAYIFVQMNSILDAATANVAGSNVYSASWLGPPPRDFNPDGSLAALEVILNVPGRRMFALTVDEPRSLIRQCSLTSLPRRTGASF